MNKITNIKQQISELQQIVEQEHFDILDIDICMEKIRSVYGLFNDIKNNETQDTDAEKLAIQKKEQAEKELKEAQEQEERKQALEQQKQKLEAQVKAELEAKQKELDRQEKEMKKVLEKKKKQLEKELEQQKTLEQEAEQRLVEIKAKEAQLKEVQLKETLEKERKEAEERQDKEELKALERQKEAQKKTPKKQTENKAKQSSSETQHTTDNTPKETVADQFISKKSINDHLLQLKKDNNDLASQLQNRPIANLKTAISLNDKIWFIKELFSKDNKKYETFINEVNQALDLDHALEIVEAMNWEKTQEASNVIIELIIRRFV